MLSKKCSKSKRKPNRKFNNELKKYIKAQIIELISLYRDYKTNDPSSPAFHFKRKWEGLTPTKWISEVPYGIEICIIMGYLKAISTWSETERLGDFLAEKGITRTKNFKQIYEPFPWEDAEDAFDIFQRDLILCQVDIEYAAANLNISPVLTWRWLQELVRVGVIKLMCPASKDQAAIYAIGYWLWYRKDKFLGDLYKKVLFLNSRLKKSLMTFNPSWRKK